MELDGSKNLAPKTCCVLWMETLRNWGGYIESKPVLSLDELGRFNDTYDVFISVAEKKQRDIIYDILTKQNLRKHIINSPYRNDVLRLMKGAEIDPESFFEGANYIGYDSVLSECEFGYGSYVSDNVLFTNVKCGRYSSIGENVSVIRGTHPSRRYVSTHPSFFSRNNPTIIEHYATDDRFHEFNYTENGYTVEIGNDVWIGRNVLIREGITIGNGAIIGAGSVIVKDVADYEIVGGNPAKRLRMRFSENEVDYLIKLKWWEKDRKWLEEYGKYFFDIGKLMEVVTI